MISKSEKSSGAKKIPEVRSDFQNVTMGLQTIRTLRVFGVERRNFAHSRFVF